MEASSAEAALRILREGTSIDLVVTDHAMPGMTGLELAERIRAEWPTLPILLASGHAELPERSGLSIPRLAKPFRRDELEQSDRVPRHASLRAGQRGALPQALMVY